MKISISGTLGSGKSTVAKMVAKAFNLKQYQSGGFMRDMATERGMTLNELQVIAERDRSIDDEIDARQIKLGKEEDDFILEARLGYHFVPDSLKVYLKTSIDVAASRIMLSLHDNNSERVREGLVKNKAEIIKSLMRRRESEKMRYSDLYGIDYEDESNYDLVIDTSIISAVEVSNIIIAKIKERYSLE
jgi:cytidylate kinase